MSSSDSNSKLLVLAGSAIIATYVLYRISQTAVENNHQFAESAVKSRINSDLTFRERSHGITIRIATMRDISSLIRLRKLFFERMNYDFINVESSQFIDVNKLSYVYSNSHFVSNDEDLSQVLPINMNTNNNNRLHDTQRVNTPHLGTREDQTRDEIDEIQDSLVLFQEMIKKDQKGPNYFGNTNNHKNGYSYSETPWATTPAINGNNNNNDNNYYYSNISNNNSNDSDDDENKGRLITLEPIASEISVTDTTLISMQTEPNISNHSKTTTPEVTEDTLIEVNSENYENDGPRQRRLRQSSQSNVNLKGHTFASKIKKNSNKISKHNKNDNAKVANKATSDNEIDENNDNNNSSKNKVISSDQNSMFSRSLTAISTVFRIKTDISNNNDTNNSNSNRDNYGMKKRHSNDNLEKPKMNRVSISNNTITNNPVKKRMRMWDIWGKATRKFDERSSDNISTTAASATHSANMINFDAVGSKKVHFDENGMKMNNSNLYELKRVNCDYDEILCRYFKNAISSDKFVGFLAFDIDSKKPDYCIAASGIVIDEHVPSPNNLSGKIGYILDIVVENDYKQINDGFQNIEHDMMLEMIDWLKVNNINVIAMHPSLVSEYYLHESNKSNESQAKGGSTAPYDSFFGNVIGSDIDEENANINDRNDINISRLIKAGFERTNEFKAIVKKLKV